MPEARPSEAPIIGKTCVKDLLGAKMARFGIRCGCPACAPELHQGQQPAPLSGPETASGSEPTKASQPDAKKRAAHDLDD